MAHLIDTHAHLYDESFATDLTEVIDRARTDGVQKIYMPNIDVNSIAPMLKLEEDYPDLCVPMMGIHPCYIDSGYRSALNVAESWLNRRKFSAIGEIGIDLYWDKTYVAEQEIAFQVQLNWAKELQLPVAIHCRESLDIVIKLVKTQQDGRLRGIFHCFSGDARQSEEIRDIGFIMGIGGVATFKNSGLPGVLSNIGLDHIVLETDSPYLAPVPHRGKRNEPGYLAIIASKIAEILQCTEEEVRFATTMNAYKLFENG